MRAVRRLTTPKMCCTDKKLPGYGKQWDIEREVTVMAPDAFDNATHKPGGNDEPPLDYYGGNVYQYPLVSHECHSSSFLRSLSGADRPATAASTSCSCTGCTTG